ncbi:MAG: hypothetical protein NC308_11245 [Clostridium sp.]|nr:hypothetical protein [Bacteroides sp.]MCM1199452.1 hypothetical protein [Clostridium sp.]
MITEWWTSLDPFMRTLWIVALGSSLIFVIESIMTFIGADAGDTGGIDMDFDTGIDELSSADGSSLGSNLYTFRNFVNFCLGFGWTAILLRQKVDSTGLLLLIAIAVGIALVAIVMYMFKLLDSMQQSGTINVYKSAVGCQGRVYLTIPGERSGEGKVQISINNAVREYTAITDGDTIANGKAIKVVEVIDSSTMLVEEINSLII